MRHRLPLSLASTVESRSEIVIRHQLPTDEAALQRLADLTGRRLPGGHLLVAEADGELVAVAGDNGATLGDPFRVTVDVIELLRVRAAQLRFVAA